MTDKVIRKMLSKNSCRVYKIEHKDLNFYSTNVYKNLLISEHDIFYIKMFKTELQGQLNVAISLFQAAEDFHMKNITSWIHIYLVFFIVYCVENLSATRQTTFVLIFVGNIIVRYVGLFIHELISSILIWNMFMTFKLIEVNNLTL